MRFRICLALGVSVLAAAPAFADRERGRKVFRQNCAGCHSIGCNRTGPKLGALVGRKAASVPDYAGYSKALKASGIVWTDEALDAFLANPPAYLPGNGMGGYGRVADDADRAALLEFLRLPDTSLDLCP